MSQQQEAVDPWTTEAKQQQRQKVSELLAEYGKNRTTMVDTIDRHPKGGSKKVTIPYEMDLERAEEVVHEKKVAEEEEYQFHDIFLARPPDAAWNFTRLLSQIWEEPIGKGTKGWFASPPQRITVALNKDEKVSVPWGEMYFSAWETTFHLQPAMHPEYGLSTHISATGMKKYEADILNFFVMFKDYLAEHSIYSGKSMRGVTQEVEFYDPYEVDREIFAYSQENFWELKAYVWGLIEHADLIRRSNAGYKLIEVYQTDEQGEQIVKDDEPLTRWVVEEELTTADEVVLRHGVRSERTERTHIKMSNNVLLSGDNGGGKTGACAITGQYCLEYGYTFVEVNWNEPLSQALRFVQGFNRPAVMVLEDVEHLFKNPDAMEALLGEFDGMRTKGFEITLLMTTNHIEDIPKSMKGGHRIDHTITIGTLDQPGVQRLIDHQIPTSQRVELDYDVLYDVFQGWMPAFIVRALEDVVKFSMIRTGKLGQPVTTEDIVAAARAKQASIEQHQLSTDRPERPALEEALEASVEKVLQRHMVDLDDGEIMVRS